jgi:hypothetical protein
MRELVLVPLWNVSIENRLEFIRVPSLGSCCRDADFRRFSQCEFAEEGDLQKD